MNLELSCRSAGVLFVVKPECKCGDYLHEPSYIQGFNSLLSFARRQMQKTASSKSRALLCKTVSKLWAHISNCRELLKQFIVEGLHSFPTIHKVG